MLSDEERFRRPFDISTAEKLLRGAGVRFERVTDCWVDCAPGKPRRQAVQFFTGATWVVRGVDTGVPLEKVAYFRRSGGAWVLDACCRVLPLEWDAFEEAAIVADFVKRERRMRSLADDVYRDLMPVLEDVAY